MHRLTKRTVVLVLLVTLAVIVLAVPTDTRAAVNDSVRELVCRLTVCEPPVPVVWVKDSDGRMAYLEQDAKLSAGAYVVWIGFDYRVASLPDVGTYAIYLLGQRSIPTVAGEPIRLELQEGDHTIGGEGWVCARSSYDTCRKKTISVPPVVVHVRR